MDAQLISTEENRSNVLFESDVPDLSIVVPTRNEAGNVEKLLLGIQSSMTGKPIEVIFVDDFSDNTSEVIQRVSHNYDGILVNLIHRLPEQQVGGLGGAVVAGLQAARADFVCVMDGDLQHPPSLLPTLLLTAKDKNVDIVVATRRAHESQVEGLNLARNFVSRVLDLTARIFFPKQLKGVSDPLTGFFLLRTKAINIQALRPKGFKILLEILVRNPKLKKAEVPFHFGERFAGQSKASAKEVFKYISLLWTLRFGESSSRFIGFAAVGISGVFINSAAIFLATDIFKIYYLYSAVIATIVSTIWNFALNELWVFRNTSNSSKRFNRLLVFMVMNMIALSLRAPLMYVFTSLLTVHYILSNLLSIGLLTIVRFVLADNFIWSSQKSNITVMNK